MGLARAYAMQGDTAKARAAYQEFLTLWKDADADVPVFIAAKAEFVKLKYLSVLGGIRIAPLSFPVSGYEFLLQSKNHRLWCRLSA